MEAASSQDDKGNCPPKPDKRFVLWYMGWSSLDRRTTLPMLPWLVAEIRRRSEKSDTGPVQAREVELTLIPPIIRCVPANSSNTSVFIFEHKAQFISRFIHNSHDLTYFAYLIRSQPGNPESEMACHVFKASDPNQVPDVISNIRQVSKAALNQDSRPKQEGDGAFYNSQKFEVLYCGKAMVADKKAPSTLIDDCVKRFQHYEVERKLSGPLGSSHCSRDGNGGSGPGSAALLVEEEEEEEEEEEGDRSRSLSSSPSLGSLRGNFPLAILEDSEPEDQKGFRGRCNSLVAGQQRQLAEAELRASKRRRHASAPGQVQPSDGENNRTMLHASAPGQVQPSDAEKNRTMLFQVGRFEVNLISPDSKSVVIEKNFKDISSCSQGIKQNDHFGFICRESGESGASHYVCYVFQCANQSLAGEVMQTLKQAFSTAASLQSAQTPVKLCQACPMHDLHKLCERIEGLYPPRAKLAIQRYLSQLTDNEQVDIFERVQKMKPGTDQEENELVILHLRQLCETKQKTHLHIGEVPQSPPNSAVVDSCAVGGRFKLDILKNKARSSLTSSLENIFSRGASRMRGRLGSIGSSDQHDESPGHSPPATPTSSYASFPEEDPEGQQFRRRAHTFSHLPVRKRISFSELQPHSSKAPLRRQQSLAPELLQSSNREGGNRTFSGTGCSSLSPRRVSWRQKIFRQVATPMNKPPDSQDRGELLPLSPRSAHQDQNASSDQLPPADRPRRTPAQSRALWKKAVQQQILLLRVDKENYHREASRDELHVRKVKLDYQEVGPCPQDVAELWEKVLSVPGRAMVQWDREEIQNALSQGVPKSLRGEVWQLLSQQYRLRPSAPSRHQPADTSYQDLLKHLTSHQHAILVDLGRTFPTHPYFSRQLGAGQLSLYNLLKAYSLLDTEVGYCQGISFVAGVLLLHMGEEQAFELLKFLMYDLGFRKQYRPDMVSLQVQMYQLSRLLHDYHRDLYCHLEELEVCPSLYAAPWFLTLFASQFSLGFVARIFDIIFIQGTEVIFKVALCLLSSHKVEVMECDSFETVVDYLKTTIPTLSQAQMEQTVSQVMEMDISKQLHAYEVEYHVLQDEILQASAQTDQSDRLDRLERANSQLKRQNMDLLEKLHAAQIRIQSLEVNVENFLARESQMKHVIRSLEQEKASCQRTMERLRGCLPPEAVLDVELTQIRPGFNGKLKA